MPDAAPLGNEAIEDPAIGRALDDTSTGTVLETTGTGTVGAAGAVTVIVDT